MNIRDRTHRVQLVFEATLLMAVVAKKGSGLVDEGV
jgi:hypothetical protein